MIRNLIVILLTFGTSMLNAQVLWQNVLGGSADDGFNEVIKVEAGWLALGYSASGDGQLTENKGLRDAWAVLMNNEGELIWSESYGGAFDDEFMAGVETQEGYLVAGYASSAGGDIGTHWGGTDGWVVQLDFQGNLVWEGAFGGGGNEVFSDLIVAEDQYVLTGSAESLYSGETPQGLTDVWLLAIGADKIFLWEKSIGGASRDEGFGLETWDEKLFIGASTRSDVEGWTAGLGGEDFWLICTNLQGEFLFDGRYGGEGNDRLASIGLNETGIYLIGETSSEEINDYRGLGDVLTVKTTFDADLIWQQLYGGGGLESAKDVVVVEASIFVTGFTFSEDGDFADFYAFQDAFLLELSAASGDLLEANVLGGNQYDGFLGVEWSDDQLVLCGFTDSADGDLSNGKHGDHLAWIHSKERISTSVIEIGRREWPLCYPNPTSHGFKLEGVAKYDEITIYSHFGKMMHSGRVSSYFDVSDWPEGCYYIQLSGDSETTFPLYVIH